VRKIIVLASLLASLACLGLVVNAHGNMRSTGFYPPVLLGLSLK
jgi:hypothetical protein